MRGNIWTIVAIGVGAAFIPVVLDIDTASGTTSRTIMDLLSAVGILPGLAFTVVVFGLLIAFFTDSGF